MNSKILEQIELLFGCVGVILGIFFAVFLLVNHRKQPKASFFLGLYLLTFSLRIGKSVFHYFYTIDPIIRNFFLSILFCVGPSLWLYTRYLMTSNASSNVKDVLHYILFIIVVLVCPFITNNGPDASNYVFAIFYNGIIIHMLAYCLFTIFWFKNNKEQNVTGEEKSKTKWLTYFLAINIVLVLLYFLISQLILPFYIGLSFLFSCVIIFFSVWVLRNPFLFKISIIKYVNSTIDEKKSRIIIRDLKKYIEAEKPYLNASLSLSNLSDIMNVSVKELSQAINQIEKSNYSQLISKYRIEEAKHLLVSPSHKHFTIAAIAYDCGFNSISSFNTVFKKITNTTPLEYQKTNRKS